MTSGYNDGGGKFKYKEVSLGMFKRFFDIMKTILDTAKKGLYGSWLFGGPDRLVHNRFRPEVLQERVGIA